MKLLRKKKVKKLSHQLTVGVRTQLCEKCEDLKSRLCEADGKPAHFLRWVSESWVIEPSALQGGHPGGTVRCTFALVEYADGTVRKVEPEDVKFTDRRAE